MLVAALGLSYLAIPEVSELPAETPAPAGEREVTSSTAVDVVPVDPSVQARAEVEALLKDKKREIKTCVRQNEHENGSTARGYSLDYRVKFAKDARPYFSAKTPSSKSSKTIDCIRSQLSDELDKIARAPGVIELEVTGHYLVR